MAGDHAETEDRAFCRVVEDVELDQSGVELPVIELALGRTLVCGIAPIIDLL